MDSRANRGFVQIVEKAGARASAVAQPGTQVVQRVALLLRLLTANHRQGMRLVDLAEASAIERPTVHRLLQGLIAERLVSQERGSKLYRLGPAMYEMGLAAAPGTQLRDLCHPHLVAIAQETGDTVFLTVPSGFDGVCVDRTEGAYPIKVFVLDVGRRRPLQIGASGLAILSAMADDEVERINVANKARLAEHYPNHSDAEFRQRLAQARRQGYALKDVLEVSGVRAVAVPVRDTQGRPVAAISVSTLAQRLKPERAAEVADAIRRAVTQIEQRIR
jgi:DNA-binding IclR family transcriptional regulator